MSRKLTALVGLAAMLVMFSISTTRAQWVKDGILVSGAGPQADQYQEVISDGSGGAILVWWRSTALGGELYAQRIDGRGNLLWGSGGVPVCTVASNKLTRGVVSDGAGGAIVIWEDDRNTVDYDLYAQRIDGSGNLLWAIDGVAVAAAGGEQTMAQAISDGAGGVIVTWYDGRSMVDKDIYAQRLDAAGNPLWAANGIVISAETGNQIYPAIVSDGWGGAIIVWMDARTSPNYDLYAQRVDASGNLKLPVAGRIVCNYTSTQNFPTIVSDGAHGVIVAWQDDRSGVSQDIYAQRLDYTGQRVWAWDGVPVCTATGWQSYAGMAVDDSSGVFIAWADQRGANEDIYAQHIDENGNSLWAVDGVAVRIGSYDDACCPEIMSDGMGGVIIAWEDIRIVGDEDIYVQRLDRDGNAKWQLNGLVVCKEANSQYYTKIASMDPGSAIITWYDFRYGASKVYAQRIDKNFGYWGNVAGQISAIHDIAKDQGGKVEVKWDASRLDAFGSYIVTHYSVWRAVPPAKVASFSASEFVDPSAVGRDFEGPAYRVERTSAGNYYWEWVGNTDARYFQGYSYAVPTLSDSMASHPAVHYFEILTHTSDPFVFWASEPDSGYSVDNLAPAPPQGLAGDYSYALGELTLNWKANRENDLARYAVYRDVGADFIPSDQNRIATVTDTLITGLPYPPEQPYYIKLSAVDIHGNESSFAILPPESVTTPTMVTGFEAAWKNRYVEVSWEMSENPADLSFVVERKGGLEAGYR
ncbi:MAG: hypothetical protein GXO82_06900, partial [Chlorobi bacterium]|nr:hypothetical protein [Chlorobiota bacterium]